MIISYWIQNHSHGCECCGEFRNIEHFRIFSLIEARCGRIVSNPKVERA